ncbi:MAG: pilus assembly PilX N-terminal domain-containing protein [bacterium]
MSVLLSRNKNGFASIVVSLILVLVFSLITLGFAQIARREQQNSLNQQLSTQANFAAESAVNRVVKQLNTNSFSDIGNCDDTTYSNLGSSAGTNGVKVTCVLLNTTSVKDYQSAFNPNGNYFVIDVGNDNNAASFSFKWQNPKSNSVLSNTSKNPVNDSNYTAPSIVQISITPLKVNEYSRSCLINKTYNMFIYPSSSTPQTSYNSLSTASCGSSNNVATKYTASCSTSTGTCEYKFNNNNNGTSKYLFSMIAPYARADTTFTLTANKTAYSSGSMPEAYSLYYTQAEIDVTAKAQDIVKRIKVRVPLKNSSIPIDINNESPAYVLQSTSICKRLEVATATTQAGLETTITTNVNMLDSEKNKAETSSSCYLLDPELTN